MRVIERGKIHAPADEDTATDTPNSWFVHACLRLRTEAAKIQYAVVRRLEDAHGRPSWRLCGGGRMHCLPFCPWGRVFENHACQGSAKGCEVRHRLRKLPRARQSAHSSD